MRERSIIETIRGADPGIARHAIALYGAWTNGDYSAHGPGCVPADVMIRHKIGCGLTASEAASQTLAYNLTMPFVFRGRTRGPAFLLGM